MRENEIHWQGGVRPGGVLHDVAPEDTSGFAQSNVMRWTFALPIDQEPQDLAEVWIKVL